MPGSHPFIVGYGGRIYRTLWGGSAVSDPVLEVELGDVDGGGAQELIVLEAGDDGLERVAVWRWHGWGFSLMWRSEPGRYRDLVLLGGEADRPIISVIEVWVIPGIQPGWFSEVTVEDYLEALMSRVNAQEVRGAFDIGGKRNMSKASRRSAIYSTDDGSKIGLFW